MDSQTSADTNAFAKSKTTGAMTFCFALAVESLTSPSYRQLLTAMHDLLAGHPNDVMRKALTSGVAKQAYDTGSGVLTAQARSAPNILTQAVLHECSYMQANLPPPGAAALPSFAQRPQLTAGAEFDEDKPVSI